MQATNGFVVRRKRGRLIGCVMLLALALSGLVLAPAAANAETTTYIATGDSITFGYTQEKFNVNFPNESPSYFDEGFDHFLTKSLSGSTEIGPGVVDVNAACPGETSNGYIGENELIGGQKSTEPSVPPGEIQGLGDWHPCAYHQVDGFPLHYSLGSHSQLEEVLAILKEGKPAHPVRAITVNIGSNDELAAISQCKKEVKEEFEKEGKSKYGASPEAAVKGCIEYTAVHVTIPHIAKNLGDILGVIDSTSPGGGHYNRAIVVVGFYNPDSFVLPGSDALQKGVNQVIEKEVLPFFPNATFANPFPVFNKGQGKSVTLEQEAICKYTEMCNPNVQVAGGKPEGKDGDIHPSLTGYKALAGIVNKAWLANPAK
jgi:lysophospholipase L1-like esterase